MAKNLQPKWKHLNYSSRRREKHFLFVLGHTTPLQERLFSYIMVQCVLFLTCKQGSSFPPVQGHSDNLCTFHLIAIAKTVLLFAGLLFDKGDLIEGQMVDSSKPLRSRPSHVLPLCHWCRQGAEIWISRSTSIQLHRHEHTLRNEDTLIRKEKWNTVRSCVGNREREIKLELKNETYISIWNNNNNNNC